MKTFVQCVKYKELLFLLVSRDIKLKYRRSILGYLWSIINPLMIMIIMTIVFSKMFRFNIENFPVYLLCGSLLFGFMQNSSVRALNSIIDNASLIKKIYVPKYIFTVSAVTSELINLLFAFFALLVVMFITGVPFTLYFLILIIPLIEIYVFCLGLGLFLAQAAVFFRDISYIWSVLCTAWMYLTPIFYPIELLPDSLRWIIIKFNPLYYFITAFRGSVLRDFDGLINENILYGAVAAIVFLLLGSWIYALNRNKFILHI